MLAHKRKNINKVVGQISVRLKNAYNLLQTGWAQELVTRIEKTQAATLSNC